MQTLRAEVRAFLDDERARGTVLGRPDSWFAGWDREFSRRLAERGWVGMTLPTAYGGGGRSPLERYVVIEELLAAGAPVAAHWVSDRQAGPSILAHGTDVQRGCYLPAITRDECFFSIGMSEEGAGSDLAAVTTRAARDDDGTWRLSGTKMWTGGAHVNDAAIVLARSEPDSSRHDGLSQFIVDLRAPEVEVEPIRLLTGEHRFNATHLHGVPGDLLGAEGSGWAQVTGELGHERSGPERFLSTFPLLAAVLRARSDLDPAELARIGLLVARLAALRRLSLGVAGALERGESPDVAAALVKDLGTRYEGAVVEEVRALSPVPADAGAAEGSLAELLALGITHLPGYTLRGGTNEILRGIITKGLPDDRPDGAPDPVPAPDAPLADLVAHARAVGADPEAGPPVEELAARAVLASAGLVVPDGPVTLVVTDTLTVADAGEGRVRLDGTLTRVPRGREAAVVVVTEGDERAVVLEPGTGLVGTGENLAGEQRDALTFVGVEAAAVPVDGAARILVLLRAAAMSGASRRAGELAIAHVRAREQFGRPLVSFQAVKQDVARLVEEVALVEAAVAAGVERGDELGPAVAKAQASASVAEITRIAHQLHGAVGFTERSPLRLSTTRLWSWRDEDGDERVWAGRVGAAAVRAGDLWDLVAR